MNDIKKAISMMKWEKENFDPNDHIRGDFDLAIKALEKQIEDRLIPVTERLPEDSGPYLVQFNYGYNSQDWFEVVHFQHKCKKWKRLDNLAVAWQPLPLPYKED